MRQYQWNIGFKRILSVCKHSALAFH